MAIADILVNNHLLNNSGIDEQSGNDMTSSGATYSITAKLGSHSMFFDGLNDITTQDSSTDLDETQLFAFVCWFKPDISQVGYANIMGIRVSSSAPGDIIQGTGFALVRYNSGADTLQFIVRNTSSTVKTLLTASGYKDDAWHLLIVGRDSSNRLRMNLDGGVEDLTGAALTGSWWESGDFFKIGAFYRGSEQYNGYIDNVLTLNAWPDASEIAEIWNGGAGQEFDGVATGRRRKTVQYRQLRK